VTPAYRLNLFGFLASSSFSSSSPVPNLGFWDQRLALEWTWQNISLFSGNASNLTIGGYSAGAYSVFHQLAYDLGVPDRKSIVKRALMLSNGPGMQPKSLEDAQLQYNELLAAMGISKDLSTDEKMAKLRGLSTKALVQASMKMMHHQFRPVTDNSFVRPNLLHELESGSLARCMKRRNIKLVIGECQDEHFVYAAWKPPTNNLAGLFERLQADYPLPACEALVKHYYPGGRLPDGVKDWREAFGRLYADIQIHHLERGMINSLVKHSAGHLVYRYRMEWRAQCCDEKVPRSWGVTHATDLKIWFWGDGSDLSRKEKVIVKKAFNDNLAKFVKNGEMDWGTTHPLQIRTLKANGSVEIEDDGRMEEGLRVWEVLKRAGVMGMSMKDSKL
jgi:carboxylesterase type B